MSSLRSLATYLAFRKRRFADRACLERWQEQRVRKHLLWICSRSSWFRQISQKIPIERWRDWPFGNKASMSEHLEQYCTVPIDAREAWRVAEESMRNRDFSPMLPGSVAVGMSSGTSGRPGLFLTSGLERAEWAGAILARVLPGGLFSKHWRLALFLRANNNLYQATRGKRVRFHFFDLAGELERHWGDLVEVSPHVLAAPPRVLLRLAEAQNAGEISIGPEKVVSVAEVLEPWMKVRIEEAFRTKCHQIYQATEGFLGVTCREGRMHLNEDIVLVEREAVGHDANVFRPILTDFRRRTQPVIRYRMEDVLRASSEACPCGSPFLAIDEIIGRSDETCILLSEQGEEMDVLPDFLRLSAAEVLGREFRLVNLTPGKLRVEAMRVSEAERVKLALALGAACVKSSCAPAALEFGELPAQSWKDKLKRVVRDSGKPQAGMPYCRDRQE